MNKKILILPGDGIGTEVTDEAAKVIEKIGEKFGHEFTFDYALIGAAAIDHTGSALPKETIDKARSADSILLGAVGDPRFNDPSLKVRPEQGILAIRKELELFANIRPMQMFDSLIDASPIKADIVRGSDILFFRELTGGIYFGTPRERRENGEVAVDTLIYSKAEIRRIVIKAFEAAKSRKKFVTSIDKANVLESSRLWREVVEEVAKNYPDIKFEHQLVDSAAMRFIKEPTAFDVVVSENMFGDILTDELAQIGGSLGLLASASLGEKYSLYEPAHGSAPDIAGENKANPIATILSVKMMFELTFGLFEEAKAIGDAINKVLEEGYRTGDIKSKETLEDKILGTKEMGDRIVEKMK